MASSTNLQPGATGRNMRLDWPDVAKGFCMVLVVLWHVALWMRDEFGGATAVAPWAVVAHYFSPLRMPLFFFISGFLSARALARPLQESRRRTIGLYYLYSLWTCLFLSRLFIPQARDGGQAPSLSDLALSLLMPTSYWYLWALPAFFIFTWFVDPPL